MEKLVFIDDDEDKLRSFGELVAGAYECVTLHWPSQKPDEDTVGMAPAIFVSDLYLPSADYSDTLVDFPTEELQRQAEIATEVASCFPKLYPGPRNAKKRMRETMKCRPIRFVPNTSALHFDYKKTTLRIYDQKIGFPL